MKGPQKARNDRPHNKEYLNEFRVSLRKNLTPAEAALWKILKGSSLDGRKFRRQHSIGNYILDFYCPDEKLAVELDGEVHVGLLAQEKDENRTAFLNDLGIRVLRFENKMVFENTRYVNDKIRDSFGWWKE